MGDDHVYRENKYFDHNLSSDLLTLRGWYPVTQLVFYVTGLEIKRVILLMFIEELGSKLVD